MSAQSPRLESTGSPQTSHPSFEAAAPSFDQYVLVPIDKTINSCYPQHDSYLHLNPEQNVIYASPQLLPIQPLPHSQKRAVHNFNKSKPLIHSLQKHRGYTPQAPTKFDTPNRRRPPRRPLRPRAPPRRSPIAPGPRLGNLRRKSLEKRHGRHLCQGQNRRPEKAPQPDRHSRDPEKFHTRRACPRPRHLDFPEVRRSRVPRS